MKLKNFLVGYAAIFFVAGISACKKNSPDETDPGIATTFKLSSDAAVSDNLNSDAEYVFTETAIENNLTQNTPMNGAGSTNVLGCAIVTISPLMGFPKNVTIDFGAGCTSINGIIRSGKINVILSDSLQKTGTTAVMNFANYVVNGYKNEGTLTWTTTTQNGIKSWTRKCENGKVTEPGGRFWLHIGMQAVTQTDGGTTPFNLLDDAFSITGSHIVTNQEGISGTAEITEALQKKVMCANIDKGKVKLQGPNHYAIIDYGDGTCDKNATISIDGGNPKNILLW